MLPEEVPDVLGVLLVPEEPEVSLELGDALLEPEDPEVPLEFGDALPAPEEPEVPDVPEAPDFDVPPVLLLPDASDVFAFDACRAVRLCLVVLFALLSPEDMPLDDCWLCWSSLACCSTAAAFAGSVLSVIPLGGESCASALPNQHIKISTASVVFFIVASVGPNLPRDEQSLPRLHLGLRIGVSVSSSASNRLDIKQAYAFLEAHCNK